ncbi:hypothetical protein CPB85DRAFT_434671 [Mucidula mucida]|nr:hypothetical protein CPB85DRAFT_434671 [Mucidula mucida]
MARQVQATVDEDPSLWRIIITPTLFISAFFFLENGISLDAYVLMGLAAARLDYNLARDVTPDIAARIPRGE